jgi:transcriptional regulator
MTDSPKDFIDQMLGAIVGIEIGITRLLGKWKLSQNQPPANQTSLIKALAGTPMGELIRQQQQQ